MRRRLKDFLAFLGAHPVGVIWAVLLLLLLVVILQNVEPVRIDVLFWSLPFVPKLVLILVAMAVGGALTEGARMLLRRRARRSSAEVGGAGAARAAR